MKLPEPKLPDLKYYTIKGLATAWGTTPEIVEHYLLEDMLKASINLSSAEYICCDLLKDGTETFRGHPIENGIFEIYNYKNIDWNDSKDGGFCCDFNIREVRVFRDNSVYTFFGPVHELVKIGADYENVRYSDIIIMAEEVERFKLKYFAREDNSSIPLETKTQDESSSDAIVETQQSQATHVFNLSEYVKQSRKEEKTDEQICFDLMRDYGKSDKRYSKPNSVRLSALAIGIAVFPNVKRQTKKEKDNLESYVWKRVESYSEKNHVVITVGHEVTSQ
jgi:hypothetical protein